jgi:hypothetical protein
MEPRESAQGDAAVEAVESAQSRVFLIGFGANAMRCFSQACPCQTYQPVEVTIPDRTRRLLVTALQFSNPPGYRSNLFVGHRFTPPRITIH